MQQSLRPAVANHSQVKCVVAIGHLLDVLAEYIAPLPLNESSTMAGLFALDEIAPFRIKAPTVSSLGI